MLALTVVAALCLLLAVEPTKSFADGELYTQPPRTSNCNWLNGLDKQTAEKRAETIRAHYPVQQTTDLQIVYIDGCGLDMIWSDGIKSARDISFWRPSSAVFAAFPGFGYPGDMPAPQSSKDKFILKDPKTYATFLVKAQPGYENFLTPGDPPRVVWSDANTQSKPDVKLLQPSCPQGYDPLGMYFMLNYPNTPSSNVSLRADLAARQRFTCFSRSITSPMAPYKDTDKNSGEPNGAIWSTSGVRNGHDYADKVAFFQVQRASSDKPSGPGKILVPPPTFWAKPDSFDVPDTGLFRGLQLPLTQPVPKSIAAARPTLTAPNNQALSIAAPTVHEYPVSALVVNDEQAYPNDLAKYLESPTYLIRAETTWKAVDGGRFCETKPAGSACDYKSSVTTGESTSKTWNNTVGKTLSQSATVEIGFEPLGIGGNASLSFGIEESFSQDFGGESQNSTEKTIEVSDTLHSPEYAVHVQSTTKYSVYRKGAINPANLVRTYTDTAGAYDLIEYNTDPAPAGDFPLTSIGVLVPGNPLYSQDKKHYLLLTEGGTLEVRAQDQGVLDDQYEWSLDEIASHGKTGHPITNVTFTNGQLRVKAKGEPDFVKPSTAALSGAQIEIVDGSLRITYVDANKRTLVAWTTKVSGKTRAKESK